MDSATLQATTTGTDHKAELAQGLKQVLADTYAIMGMAHFFHWNVEGTGFFSLHEAFERQYTNMFEAADDIAERLRAIGFYAPGGLKKLSEIAELEEYDAPMDAKGMVTAMINAHQKAIRDIVELRKLSGEAQDTVTEDLMNDRLRHHDKYVWMLKSYVK